MYETFWKSNSIKQQQNEYQIIKQRITTLSTTKSSNNKSINNSMLNNINIIICSNTKQHPTHIYIYIHICISYSESLTADANDPSERCCVILHVGANWYNNWSCPSVNRRKTINGFIRQMTFYEPTIKTPYKLIIYGLVNLIYTYISVLMFIRCMIV